MSIVFINYPLETFTPTHSGAIATIIHELSRVAQSQGHKPLVVSRRGAAVPFDDVETHFIDFPHAPRGRLGTFFYRVQRRLGGWRHLRHGAYARRIAEALAAAGATNRPWVLFNDPETAVYLRQRFPNAFILHWFQNLHHCKPAFRSRFGSAASKVAACSRFTADWVETFYGMPRGSVAVVHNGVDTRSFAPPASIPNGPPVVNFVGRTGVVMV